MTLINISSSLNQNELITITYENDVWKILDIEKFVSILPDSLSYILDLSDEGGIVQVPFMDVKIDNPSYAFIFLLNVIEDNLKDFRINPIDNETVARLVPEFIDKLRQIHRTRIDNLSAKTGLVINIG